MKLLFVLLLLLSNAAFAKTVCVCDIAEDVRDHWLWVGCKAKQMLNSCDIQTSVKHGDFAQLNSELRDKLQKGDTLRITYLGHWGMYRTLPYIDEFLVPLASNYKIDIIYENTGCLSMEKPKDVQAHLSSLKLQDSSISIMGNQSTSVGAASLFYSNGRDLYGYASSKWKRHRYTDCKYIEAQRCSGYQLGAAGVCYDSLKNVIKDVSCTRRDHPLGLNQYFWQFGTSPYQGRKIKSGG